MSNKTLTNLIVILVNFFLMITTVNAQSNNSWFKPRAYIESYYVDLDSCKQISSNNIANCLNQRGWTLIDKTVFDNDGKQCREESTASKGFDSDGKTLYQTCMLNKGWDLQAEADRQLVILNQEYKKVCEDPKYSELVKKSPCSSALITIEQLADNSKLTPTEKIVYLDFIKSIDTLTQKMDNFRSNGGMFWKKYYQFRITYEIPKVDSNRIDLIQGKTTWGEYNQKRKELDLSNRDKVKQINEEVQAFIKQKR